ncbi:MAG: HD domain-containing protein [Candidatus Pacebacteria bacterium]|nr:HD domain-containing protein [Candidatus Paceibacterota bacterium]
MPHTPKKVSLKYPIPKEVSRVTKTLRDGGFEAYLVGGCVRDMFVNIKPKDWDVTTNANPEQIQKLFLETFYENDYGTVGVVNETEDETLKVIEVTPYRTEGAYSDKRRPDTVSFNAKLEDDLKRRDFTINAIAYDDSQGHSKGHIIDPYGGLSDIEGKILRTVGSPYDRFHEDALRILRAVRLATDLGFTINVETQEAIQKTAQNLKEIAVERIRDEFSKMVMSKNPMVGIIMCEKLGLLDYIAPDLKRGIGLEQNGAHIYTIWEHNLRALQHSADRDWPLHVRLAALFHDVAKPETRRWSEEKNDWTFYGHDVVGGRVTKKALENLKYPKKIVDVASQLVRYHLFFSDIEKITLSAVRRIVRNVGPENVWDLMKLRACDRIGMGRPKETPYRLRKYQSMIEEAMRAPVSVGMLKIDGKKIMDVTHETPGPRIGFILHALLEEVFDNPENNTEEFLARRAIELNKLNIEELKKLGEAGKEKKDEEEEKELAEIRKRHGVK